MYFDDNIYFLVAYIECDCDVGGAYGAVCNKTSGQCECKGNITQRQCNRFVTSISFLHLSITITFKL